MVKYVLQSLSNFLRLSLIEEKNARGGAKVLSRGFGPSRDKPIRKTGEPLQVNQAINGIKAEVEEAIGRRCIVKADKGRKRIITKKGVIENAFEDVFTVRINNEFDVERTVSFTYTDVLTSTVQLTVF